MTRRFALVMAHAVGLAVTTTGVAIAQRAPKGLHNVTVREAGFKMAIPDDWEVLNLTKGDIDAAFDNLVDQIPSFGEQFPGGISDLVAQSVVLFAATEGDAFNPNLNVILQEGADLPSLDEVEQQLLTIADDVEASETRVAGVDAVKATYELDLGTAVVHGVQYQLETDDGLLGFTFSTSTDDPMTTTVKKMRKSIDLL